MKDLLKTTFLLLGAISVKAHPTKTYYYPFYGGYRLDWCKNWAQNCGKPAADAYCEYKGYEYAISYSIDHDIG